MKKQDMPQRPRRAARTVIANWAEGEDMLEGLGGIDPDYDRADDVVPADLRGSWRTPTFEGE